MSLQINSNYGLTGLGNTTPITANILALSTLEHWFRADADVTLSGLNVTTITDRKTGTVTVVQETNGNRPLFADEAFGNYPGINFSGSKRLASGASIFNAEGPCTMVWIGKVNAGTGTTQAAMSVRTDATNQVFLGVNGSGALMFQTGTQFSTSALTFGDVVCAVGSITGTTRKFWVNGTRAADLSMTAGSGANAEIVMGALSSAMATGTLDGVTHDAMFFSADLMESTSFLELMGAYATRLGATIA